jgi:hypothetical protein
LKDPQLAFSFVKENVKNSLPIGMIPQGIFKNTDREEGGDSSGIVLLSSWRGPKLEIVPVGDWNMKKTDSDTTGKVKTEGWSASEAGEFLRELTEKKEATLFLHASYLGSIHSFSQKLVLKSPVVSSTTWSLEGSILNLSFVLDRSQDRFLWLQVCLKSTGRLLKPRGGLGMDHPEWAFCQLSADNNDARSNCRCALDLGQTGLDPNDLYPFFSLVPHEYGILNRTDTFAQSPYKPGLDLKSELKVRAPEGVQQAASEVLSKWS